MGFCAWIVQQTECSSGKDSRQSEDHVGNITARVFLMLFLKSHDENEVASEMLFIATLNSNASPLKQNEK